MKRVKHLRSERIYIFHGRSNANSCFIEKIEHARKFLVYANYFLKGYLKIYDYIITKDGWSMVIKINKFIPSAETSDQEIWRDISERMRLFLSTFVRVTNKQKGRTGCLVHSGYEKYEFESKKEAIEYIEKLRSQKIKFYSRRKKYQAFKTHYEIDTIQATGSVFLCSRDIRMEKNKVKNFDGIIDFTNLTELVAQNNEIFSNDQKTPSPPT